MSEAGPGQTWDRLVECALQQASTRTSERRFGFVRLELTGRVVGKHLVAQARNLAEIDPILRQAIRAAVMGESTWPLFVHGPAGCGKTCAALCVLDQAGGEYHTVSGLCETVIRAQQGRLDWSHEGRGGLLWPEQFWRQLAAAPLVVLDELGCRERVSDFGYECVKRAIDERQGKPLVVLSNLDLERIAALYDDRVASRLAAGTVIELVGEDRRLRG